MPQGLTCVNMAPSARNTRALAILVLASVVAGFSANAPAVPTLTTARAVHSMTNDQARHGSPVHLTDARVLYYNPQIGNLFIGDASGTVYVDMRGQPRLPLQAGDILDVRGIIGVGGYAPLVSRPAIRHGLEGNAASAARSARRMGPVFGGGGPLHRGRQLFSLADGPS